MPNLKEVKARIKSVMSTQQITKAMKMVAAAKLRRAQDRMTQMRPFASKLNDIMQNVSASVGTDIENPYADQREINNVLLIVVTSDRGLCGAFNSNIFKAAKSLIEEKYQQYERGGLTILPIGKRSYEFFKKRNYLVIDDYYNLFHELNFDGAVKAAEFVMNSFREGEYDQVEIVYNEFKNVATQIIRKEQFLPILRDESDEFDDIDYLYEPSMEFIFNEIVPKSLKIQLYRALLESNASEQGARMTAMDQATENADDLLKDLRLTYNRTRQAAITKEILEIVGGAEALSQGR